MTLGEFRKLTADMPDDAELQMVDCLPITGAYYDQGVNMIFISDVEEEGNEDITLISTKD